MSQQGEYTWVEVGEWTDANPIRIPIAQFGAKNRGKRLWVQASVHGDEFNGIEVCHQLCRMLEDRESIDGSITVVPVTNAAALWTATGHSSIDFLNLSNAYPGNQAGVLTERVANWIVSRILEEKPDVVFDLHTGSVFGIACGFSMCPPRSDDTTGFAAEAAYWFGTPWIYRPDTEKNRLREVLWKASIPAITIEIGGGAEVQQEFVDMGLHGLLQVLRWLRILPGDPVGPGKQIAFRHMPWTRVSKGGLFHPLHKPGGQVAAGQPIAEVWNWHGKVSEVIQAPCNGVLMLQRVHPVVRTGDWAIHLGDLDTSELNKLV